MDIPGGERGITPQQYCHVINYDTELTLLVGSFGLTRKNPSVIWPVMCLVVGGFFYSTQLWFVRLWSNAVYLVGFIAM